MSVSFHRAFDDFDELAETVRAWDLDLYQLERGHFRGSITQFLGDDCQLVRARFGRGLEQFGRSPRGLITFGIPADRSLRFFWRGKSVAGLQITVFPKDGELHAVSDSGFDVFTFSVSREFLSGVSEMAGFPEFLELITGKEIFNCTVGAMRSVRRLCMEWQHRLLRCTAHTGSPTVWEELCFELTLAIVQAVGSSVPVSAPPSLRLRDKALRRAIAFIKDNPTDPLTVRELCRESGASWRTLDYAFQERFAITPKEYMRAFRLNGAHKELRISDPKSKRVFEMANHWGFWHMGQFTTDYRRLFGELPSATLKRS